MTYENPAQAYSPDTASPENRRPVKLALKQLVKTYDNGHQAVRNISLDIQDGEFIVLVGPSGCGKSSILRSVAGLESITSGEIELAGRRIDTLNPAARNIAMVFQNYALYPHMTVYQNLAYGLKNRGVAKDVIAKKIQDVAQILRLEEYLDRKPAKLSGGQRQRVAMGRAIVREPELFLFDEPLSNLDAALRTHMRLEIKKLQRQLGVTSIYVTHDQVEAMTLADRIVVLNQGQIEQVGTPMSLYHDPQTQFVAGFIGSPAMNFLPGQIKNGQLMIHGVTVDMTSDALPDETGFTVGIRPEHLLPGEQPGCLHISVDIEVVEPLGAQKLLHCHFNGTPVVVVIQDGEFTPEAKAIFSVPFAQVYFFDQQGQRIRSQQSQTQKIA
ncbi:ABC transporter ATP-binding protein [Vibrio aerogenes]|nr:sn-glycerol-3-phosphate ABC transporter ATP-binding protein UgpC [Vibrio aerogenes]